MPSPRASHALKVTAVVLLTSAALLAGAELVARATFAEPRPPWLLHPFLGRVRPPNAELGKTSLEDGTRFVYRTNVLGMRGSSITTVAKPPGTYRIFFVGGSTTENSNLPEEQTFPALVEKALTTRLGGHPRVEVANAGVSGANSAAALAEVAQRILALEPDLVFSLEGNDFFEALRDDWDPTTFALARHYPARFMDWVKETSRLLQFVDARFSVGAEDDPRPMIARRVRKRHAQPIVDPPETTLLRGRDLFRRHLRGIAALCRDAHVPVVFLTTAFLYKPTQPPAEDAVIWLTDVGRWNLSTATARRGVDAYNEVVREVARDTGERLVDLDRAVPHDLADIADDVHLTARGNVAVADAIVAELLAHGSLPPRDP